MMAYPHREDEYVVYNSLGQVMSPNPQYMVPSFYEGPSPQRGPSAIASVSAPPHHQRGWSDSTTTSMNESSGKPFLPSVLSSTDEKKTKANKNVGRRLFSSSGSWVQEIVAMIIAVGAVGSIIGVLARFNGQTLPSWPYSITLNALIAILAAVAVVAMNIPLQSSMSQLKWIRFNESRTRLSDMEAYDEASRGTWGATKLLFTLRGGYLGSFGAMISIIALLLGAFSQQVVTYTVKQTDSPEGASVNRALNYTGALPGLTSATGFVPILPLKSAVYSGLFAENNRPTAPLAFECQSGNCTWDPYETLGVCAECVDLTQFVQRYCSAGAASKDCGWEVPQGARLNNSAAVFSMTSQIPSAEGDLPHATFVRLTFMGTEAYDGTPGETRPWARQCTLSTCLQTLETRVSNAVLTEKTLNTNINRTIVNITGITSGGALDKDENGNSNGDDYGVYVTGGNGTQYLLGIDALFGIRGWFSTLFTDGSASRSPKAVDHTVNGGYVVNLTVGISSGATFFDSDVVTAFYWNYYEYPDGLDRLVSDLAGSMTVAFRAFNGAVPVLGRARLTNSYVHVRWGFAVVPILVIVGAATMLVAAIIRSERSATPPWKSSALAPLLHGLDDAAKARFARAPIDNDNLREQRAYARATMVQLEEAEDGTLLRLS